MKGENEATFWMLLYWLAFAVLVVLALTIQFRPEPWFHCPEDAVWTWTGNEFPAPESRYACIPLDDLEE